MILLLIEDHKHMKKIRVNAKLLFGLQEQQSFKGVDPYELELRKKKKKNNKK